MPSRVLFSILGILAFSAVAGAAGPLAYDYDARVPAEWFQRLYDRVRADKISPPVASRIYGATTVALYESVRPGMREHRSLRHQLNGLTALPSIRRRQPYHWPSAANAALGRILRTLFADHGESLAAFAALEQEVRERFAFAADGYAERAGCPYTPPEGPGLWKPTPPAFAPAPVEPCWGELRPFVLRSGDECLTPLPPPYSADPASPLYRAALEVYEIGNGLTAEQRTIADYWSDESGGTGTPRGHWIDIVRQISLDQPLDLGRSAEAFARVGIAVADAFIACWRVKYAYDLIRPVSYVQDHIDAEWMPFLVTPPFPEYDSGHSVQSRAAATVLTAMLGSGYAFTDTTHTAITASSRRFRRDASRRSKTPRPRRRSRASTEASTTASACAPVSHMDAPSLARSTSESSSGAPSVIEGGTRPSGESRCPHRSRCLASA